jgi:hypothetical protein
VDANADHRKNHSGPQPTQCALSIWLVVHKPPVLCEADLKGKASPEVFRARRHSNPVAATKQVSEVAGRAITLWATQVGKRKKGERRGRRTVRRPAFSLSCCQSGLSAYSGTCTGSMDTLPSGSIVANARCTSTSGGRMVLIAVQASCRSKMCCAFSFSGESNSGYAPQFV